MAIEPTPLTAEEQPKPRQRYDWTKIQLGEWQRWMDLTGEDVSSEHAKQRSERIRLAAIAYGRAHGMRVESRRQTWQTLDLRFIATR
ncbi:MAG: hypothetical protein JXA67_20400 [Micromonosporaceae bacterium]|nr:hypothetical protein [Micromonosporaceae bacterium]